MRRRLPALPGNIPDELQGRPVFLRRPVCQFHGVHALPSGPPSELGQHGIRLIRTPVGDKYVMEEMEQGGYVLGGEQSGHVILHEHLPTGDGVATALAIMRVMAETDRELGDLASELVTYPQTLVNVRVREKSPIDAVPEIRAAVSRVEDALDGRGRVLVRYSGTEPLLRIMIEGPDQASVQAWAEEIAEAVRATLG